MATARQINLLVCLFLVLATLLTYQGLGDHQFLIIDDPAYVTNNAHVKSGLNLENIQWAFTTTTAEFWHPLTWMSYMLDTSLFGVTPRGYLLVNLLLHVLNTLLVFILFQKASGAVWQSAFVAALFAVHPLHVESVAWIAERKDVLSTFFGLLTLVAYARYVRQPHWSRYLATCCLFALGLMAKPMLVTLPFVMLLLDCWPLGRLPIINSLQEFVSALIRLLREKIPLFAMAAAAAAMAYVAQYNSDAVASLDGFSIYARLANMLWSYLVYIEKMFWPHALAIFYPFDASLPVWKPAAALLVLLIVSLAAILRAKRNPFFITGWLWYLGTLVPVIGVIKIGDFAMADRYTYLPLIGVFIIISWGIPEILSRLPSKKIILGLSAILVLVALSAVTRTQLCYWAGSQRLFEHALQVTENNFFAHYGLGHLYADQGEMDQAIFHFYRAVQVRPDKATLHNDLGRALALQGKFKPAIVCFTKSLGIKPEKIAAHFNLGIALAICDRPQQAVYHLAQVVRMASVKPPMRSLNGKDSAKQLAADENPEETIRRCRRLLATQPQRGDLIGELAWAYAKTGQTQKAFVLFKIDRTIPGAEKAIMEGYKMWLVQLLKNSRGGNSHQPVNLNKPYPPPE